MNKLYVMPLLFILCLGVVFGATCQYYLTSDETDGTDYLSINTSELNYVVPGTDHAIIGFTTFTPRLNFTHNVTESVLGAGIASTSTIHWLMSGNNYTDINNTLLVKNGSTIIGRQNYTLNSNDNISYVLTWLTATFDGLPVNVTFNRTFVKNVDDLVNAPNLVNSDTPFTSSWLDTNVTGEYDVNATIKLDDYLPYGGFINNTGWAVEWTVRTRVCGNYAIDESTNAGISKTKGLVFAGLALLVVMILVTVAWGLIQIFKGGGVDFLTITIAAIGGAILIMLGYIIIYFVATALGG